MVLRLLRLLATCLLLAAAALVVGATVAVWTDPGPARVPDEEIHSR